MLTRSQIVDVLMRSATTDVAADALLPLIRAEVESWKEQAFDAEGREASLADLANSWAREEQVEEARRPEEAKALVDRLWADQSSKLARLRAEAEAAVQRAVDAGEVVSRVWANEERAAHLRTEERAQDAAGKVLALEMYSRSVDAQLDEARAEIERLKTACSHLNEDVCQTLGKALGYPWLKDDPKNFPDATEVHGVCVGEHVAESIAMEAANRIKAAEERALRAEADLDTWVRRVDEPGTMHLHYDACPYKPWADKPRWETPNDAPECTCPEQHKAAYWKGQWMLERTQGDAEIATLRASRLRLAKGLIETAQGEYGIVPTDPLDEARRIVREEQG